MDNKRIMLSLLAEVMRVDGKIAAAESEFLASQNSLFGYPLRSEEVASLAVGPGNAQDVLDAVRSLDVSDRFDALNYAYQMARADGGYSPREDALMLRLATACGLETSDQTKLMQYFELTEQVSRLQGQLFSLRRELTRKGA